nr:hypothetical protein [uncultured Acetatifactor sp.]
MARLYESVFEDMCAVTHVVVAKAGELHYNNSDEDGICSDRKPNVG